MTDSPRSMKSTLRWPNTHEWALIGFFAMTFYMLWMIQENPALLGVPSFMQFAGQLATGGILAAAAWLYAGNRAKARADDVKVEGESVTVEQRRG